ncbi:hypothetical protein LINPERPRIM_LOCUS35953 [Linum perenne]
MTSSENAAAVVAVSEKEPTAKAAHKRYECLVTVRNKAIKGKGAWYWSHLEPILIRNSDTGIPNSVKLRCSLCDSVFSASNPSRTASEHLKSRKCPNFVASTPSPPQPISSIPPPVSGVKRTAAASSSSFVHHQSFELYGVSVSSSSPASAAFLHSPSPVTVVDPLRFSAAAEPPPPRRHQMLSGGKEDLGPLAMLEDSVKRLKSPRLSSPPSPALSRQQIDAAMDHLSDWVYESCGAVSFSSLDHPKFRAFLNQVGLPPISTGSLAGGRLDAKFEEAKAESDARIDEAMFFQIASDGWKSNPNSSSGTPNLVNLTVNLPNGTSLYRRAVFVTGFETTSFHAEEVLLETARGICGEESASKCVGIVSDRFKSKALSRLEDQYPWMVNFSCQIQAFKGLVKDLSRGIPLFESVAENCVKLGAFFNSSAQIRERLYKYQFQEYGYSNPLRVSKFDLCRLNFETAFSMIEDVMNSAKALKMVLVDESCELRVGFWSELEAVHSLVKLVKEMGREIEAERPLIGQCLSIWEELRAKVKEWGGKYNIGEVVGPVSKLIEKRFEKSYHPAMAAAYVLDPLYLVKDTSGKYLPPFKHLTSEQEKDVGRLVTRLVSREEAHIALMELMKWRTEGLDPVYARAVQMKERDPVSGKMRLSNPQSSRLVWETCLSEFKTLGKVAIRVIFLHATACSEFKCDTHWPLLRWVGSGLERQDSVAIKKAQKMVFVAANSKLEKHESFSSDGEKDAFPMANGDDSTSSM